MSTAIIIVVIMDIVAIIAALIAMVFARRASDRAFEAIEFASRAVLSMASSLTSARAISRERSQVSTKAYFSLPGEPYCVAKWQRRTSSSPSLSNSFRKSFCQVCMWLIALLSEPFRPRCRWPPILKGFTRLARLLVELYRSLATRKSRHVFWQLLPA